MHSFKQTRNFKTVAACYATAVVIYFKSGVEVCVIAKHIIHKLILKFNPKFKLILGKYLQKEITCFKCGNVIKTFEEKESDVRIATQIVADAYQDNCDIAIVVSADSDMIPAIELAKETKHPVYVYFPPNQYSSHLASSGNGNPIHLKRYEQRFKQSLLPDVIHLSVSDFNLQIPQKWKESQ